MATPTPLPVYDEVMPSIFFRRCLSVLYVDDDVSFPFRWLYELPFRSLSRLRS